jgi:hypothetical protein
MSTKVVNHATKEINPKLRTILSNNGSIPTMLNGTKAKDIRLVAENKTVNIGQVNLLSSSFSYIESLPGY